MPLIGSPYPSCSFGPDFQPAARKNLNCWLCGGKLGATYLRCLSSLLPLLLVPVHLPPSPMDRYRRPVLISKIIRLFAFAVCAALAVAQAQSGADADINKKIRAEENDHSQIMHTMHFLTDIYGPRLTGSPN